MTKTDFFKVIDYYKQAFPQTDDWLNSLSNNAGTLDTWFKCLEPLKVVHVTTAIDRMIDGQLAAVPAYDRDKTALTLRAYAGRIADDERKRRVKSVANEKEQRERERYEARKANKFPAGKLYVHAAKLWKEYRESGVDDEVIRERVSKDLDEYLDELCPPQESNKFNEFAEWNAG